MLGRCKALEPVSQLVPGLHEDRVDINISSDKGSKVALEVRTVDLSPRKGEFVEGVLPIPNRAHDDGFGEVDEGSSYQGVAVNSFGNRVA